MSLIGSTICGKYRISELIGRGSFGEAYRGINVSTLDEVAIKSEPKNAKTPQLENEYKLYKTLQGGFGTCNVECFGSNYTHHFLVMDLLGRSLEDLFGWCCHRFSLKTVLMLADQMISCLEWVHSKNYIHRDMKPDNFMVGVNNNSNIIYLIDLGLMTQYRDPITHKHIPYCDTTSMVGTARYASINALSGIEQSRRDDLEGLGYIWAYFLRSGLPWMAIEENDFQNKYRKVLEMKIKMTDQELFKGFPYEFVEYMEKVRELKFDETPNYAELRALLRKAFIREGFVYDYQYDWSDTLPTFSVFRTKSEPNCKSLTSSESSERLLTQTNSSANFFQSKKTTRVANHTRQIPTGKKLAKTNSMLPKTGKYPEHTIGRKTSLEPAKKKRLKSLSRRPPPMF